jgi:hypothetical protein
MNDLIITVDDGVSALVWGRRVRAALDAGRRVIAISDKPDDDYRAIGTGDGLPGYYSPEMAFFSFPTFKAVHVSGLDDPLLLQTLESEAPGSLVAWNMDIFTSPTTFVDNRGYLEAVTDNIWSPICERLMSGKFDSLFQFYGAYAFEIDPVAVERLKAMNFHSISGWSLGGMRSRLVRALRPDVDSALARARETSSACSWGVLEGGEVRQTDFDYYEFQRNPNAYPGL